MTSPKLLATILAAGAMLALQMGCASYVAVRMPGPSSDRHVEIGMHRAEVESLLRAPATSQYETHGETTVRYEYSDGPRQWSKSRAFLYIAGDLFTLFLSELVFWPIEIYADDKIKRVATARYDTSDELTEWRVRRRNGDELVVKSSSARPQLASEPPTPTTDADVTAVGGSSEIAGAPLESAPAEAPAPEPAVESAEVSAGPPDEAAQPAGAAAETSGAAAPRADLAAESAEMPASIELE